MAEPFIAEVRLMSFAFAPRGWALCNGQLLPINQNQALFSLLGTTYGGNGTTNFALPNLQGRVPVHIGNGIVQGQSAGEQTHTLTLQELAMHAHPVNGNNSTPNTGALLNNTWAAQSGSAYSNSPNSAMNASTVGMTGGSQPHNNMQPYLTISFCIALQGIFPSRN